LIFKGSGGGSSKSTTVSGSSPSSFRSYYTAPKMGICVEDLRTLKPTPYHPSTTDVSKRCTEMHPKYRDANNANTGNSNNPNSGWRLTPIQHHLHRYGLLYHIGVWIHIVLAHVLMTPCLIIIGIWIYHTWINRRDIIGSITKKP